MRKNRKMDDLIQKMFTVTLRQAKPEKAFTIDKINPRTNIA